MGVTIVEVRTEAVATTVWLDAAEEEREEDAGER